VRGDFDTMRQLVLEYDAQPPGQEALRARYGKWSVLDILVRSYQYPIAKYDVDGFRIDTVKYLAPDAVEMFAMPSASLPSASANRTSSRSVRLPTATRPQSTASLGDTAHRLMASASTLR
jgi:glycosidase